MVQQLSKRKLFREVALQHMHSIGIGEGGSLPLLMYELLTVDDPTRQLPSSSSGVAVDRMKAARSSESP